MSVDWFQDVLDFHKKLAPSIIQPLPGDPDGSGGKKQYCLGFMEEELSEIRQAMANKDVEHVADGLADLIVVTIRASLIWGIDLRPVWDEVHRANMAKVGGPVREDGKRLKPPGWTPPNIAEVLAKQRPIC